MLFPGGDILLHARRDDSTTVARYAVDKSRIADRMSRPRVLAVAQTGGVEVKANILSHQMVCGEAPLLATLFTKREPGSAIALVTLSRADELAQPEEAIVAPSPRRASGLRARPVADRTRSGVGHGALIPSCRPPKAVARRPSVRFR